MNTETIPCPAQHNMNPIRAVLIDCYHLNQALFFYTYLRKSKGELWSDIL